MNKYQFGLVVTALCMTALCGCTRQTVAEPATTQTVTESETVASTESEAAVQTEEQSIEETEDAQPDIGVSANEIVSEEEIGEALPAYTCTAFEQEIQMFASGAVNVRSGPTTDYEVVSHLAFGQEVTANGQADTGWYRILLAGQEAYVSGHYLTTQKPVENPAEQKKKTKASGGIIMVGDSRFVQMQKAVEGGGCAWVCENSKGYDWLNETAMARIDGAVGQGTRIVINLGVNDPGNVKNYATLINAKAAEWSNLGAVVYYVSVNPVWENPYTTEEQVTTFNSTMPSLLSAGIGWIDTHSWLETNGYKLVDGLHYDDATYVNIYNLIMGSI